MYKKEGAEFFPRGLTRLVSGDKLSPISGLEVTNRIAEGGEEMMPLTMAKAGETATIRKISGKDEVRQHLAELGFVVDSAVMVVSEIAGNLIVQVKDSRIALDKTMANRIMI